MPLWLVDFLTKFMWVVVKAVYPIILKIILKPMSPEDLERWKEIQRQGGSVEDVKEFNRTRKSATKPSTGKIIIKENKPIPKAPPGTRTRDR